jgi:hypothetical protein
MTDAKMNSADFLHFVAGVDKRRRILSFVCETQPLATVRISGHGNLTRCPLCQTENPISTSCLRKNHGENE